MQEAEQAVLAYLLEKWVVYLVIAFVAGFAGNKTVAYEGRSGFFLFLIIGLIGLLLGQFVVFFFGLHDYLETVSEFRFLFDFLIAYIGSFIVAAIIHFVKPV
jgi:uncharacterized membrane protein YeaQ/YmgE (transglycosylase-associated protein family)